MRHIYLAPGNFSGIKSRSISKHLNMDRSQHAVEVFDRYAHEYQEKFMDQSTYTDSLDLFCACVQKEGADILELACGPGNITRYLLDKRPDFKIAASDLSPNMIDLATQNNPSAEFQIMDCRKLDSLTQRYDALVCGFGLPYLSKEEALQWIEDAAGILRPGGIIYLSTMEDEYDKSGWRQSSSEGNHEMYIYYHEADYLTAALRENGFDILDLRRKDYLEEEVVRWKDLLIVGQKTTTEL